MLINDPMLQTLISLSRACLRGTALFLFIQESWLFPSTWWLCEKTPVSVCFKVQQCHKFKLHETERWCRQAQSEPWYIVGFDRGSRIGNICCRFMQGAEHETLGWMEEKKKSNIKYEA